MRTAVLVPAFDAASTIEAVVRDLVQECAAQGLAPECVWVIDDGCSDATARLARQAGATVLVHRHNRGKGAALRTGLRAAQTQGFEAMLAVDADGQHPPAEALRMHRSCSDPDALVIGVRNLQRAGAPRPNQLSNRFSNEVLSAFTGHRLRDTQCGLRRYPVAASLALDVRSNGYNFEAEILMRAVAAGMPIVHEPIRVLYPEQRISHFDAVRDPARIVWTVVRTAVDTRLLRRGGMS